MTNELREHRVLTQERQSVWDVKRTYTHDGHKMRVTIHHDPYEFQASAYLEFLSETNHSWHRIHELPTEEWYSKLNVIFIEKIKPEHERFISEVCFRLTKIGEDLLS